MSPPICSLLVTDHSRSVLSACNVGVPPTLRYAPFGSGASPRALGFHGEVSMMGSAHYPLGNGYRLYNPVLMRFHKPDSLTPFGPGGLNAYAYCTGDPVNYKDSTGHMSGRIAKLGAAVGRKPKVKGVTKYRPQSVATRPIAAGKSQHPSYFREYFLKNKDAINAGNRRWNNSRKMDITNTNESFRALEATGQLDYTFTGYTPYAERMTLDQARQIYTNARMKYADTFDVDKVFTRMNDNGALELDTWRYDAVIDGANGILQYGYNRNVSRVRNNMQTIRQKYIMKHYEYFALQR
jgi:RHS repeat-associated protein